MSCYERSNLVRKNLGKRKSINQSINQILDTSVHEKRERGIITYREAMPFDGDSSSIAKSEGCQQKEMCSVCEVV